MLELVEHFQFDRELGVCVVVDRDRGDERLLFVPVEVLDFVLLAAVDVDGVFVDEQRRARPVAFADDPRLRPLFDDDEVVGAGGAQADLFGRVGLAHPVVAVVRFLDHAVFGEDVQHLGGVRPESLVDAEGELEGGALQVAGHHEEVVRVDEPALHRAFEDEIRVGGDKLVERVRRGHEDREGGFAAAPGPAELLPEAGQCAGVAGDHARAESADIDAEFEGVRRDHAAD